MNEIQQGIRILKAINYSKHLTCKPMETQTVKIIEESRLMRLVKRLQVLEDYEARMKTVTVEGEETPYTQIGFNVDFIMDVTDMRYDFIDVTRNILTKQINKIKKQIQDELYPPRSI